MTAFQRKDGTAPHSPAFLHRLLVLAACVALAACEGLVDVNATANVSARHSSVLVTVKELWLNESATAVAADTSWLKFELDETRTIDLVGLTGGELTRIAEGLHVPAGTYRQIRVILAGRDEPLHESADDLDADYNNQVTYFDDEGDEWTMPLEVLNPVQGIGIVMDLKVVEVAVVVGSGSGGADTVQLVFDAARDLTEFRYSGETGFLLNPTLRAFDAGDAGTIQGAFNLSLLDIDTETGRPEIQVSAQKVDEDLGRRVIVASTALRTNGSFALYPLPLDEDEDVTVYDLVIHGPGIQTVILRDVPVSTARPGGASPITTAGIVLNPAASYEANVEEGAPVAQRGARVGFYQTLPAEEEPYLIAIAAVDPLSGRFAQPVVLSRAGSIAHATYSDDFALRTDVQVEGAGRYAVAALSPQHGTGDFSPTLLRPGSAASDVAAFSVPPVTLPAPVVPGSIAATVSATSPGKYDKGVLIVTHEGAVVAVAALDGMLQQQLGTTSLDVTDVPAGTPSAPFVRGLYHLEAWTWNAADPQDTFTRHSGSDAVDLRSITAAAASVTIN